MVSPAFSLEKFEIVSKCSLIRRRETTRVRALLFTVERLTVKFRTWRGSELPPRGKTVRLGSSTHVHTWLTRRRAAGSKEGGGRRKARGGERSAAPLYIDYESDRLAKKNKR